MSVRILQRCNSVEEPYILLESLSSIALLAVHPLLLRRLLDHRFEMLMICPPQGPLGLNVLPPHSVHKSFAWTAAYRENAV
jgi:hypothetical protein